MCRGLIACCYTIIEDQQPYVSLGTWCYAIGGKLHCAGPWKVCATPMSGRIGGNATHSALRGALLAEGGEFDRRLWRRLPVGALESRRVVWRATGSQCLMRELWRRRWEKQTAFQRLFREMCQRKGRTSQPQVVLAPTPHFLGVGILPNAGPRAGPQRKTGTCLVS